MKKIPRIITKSIPSDCSKCSNGRVDPKYKELYECDYVHLPHINYKECKNFILKNVLLIILFLCSTGYATFVLSIKATRFEERIEDYIRLL